MLTLLQIISHMIVGLEYTPEEVAAHFIAVESNHLSLEQLIEAINLEPIKPSILEMAKQKIHRWPSALTVIKLREGVE